MAAVPQEVQDYVQRALHDRLGDFAPGRPEGAAQLAALQHIEGTSIRADALEARSSAIEAGLVEVNAKIVTLREELEKHIPNIDVTVAKLNEASAKSQASLERLDNRDTEISAKLNAEFDKITAQIADLQKQAGATTSAQAKLDHDSAKQISEFDRVKMEVGEFVTNAMARVRAEVNGANVTRQDRVSPGTAVSGLSG